MITSWQRLYSINVEHHGLGDWDWACELGDARRGYGTSTGGNYDGRDMTARAALLWGLWVVAERERQLGARRPALALTAAGKLAAWEGQVWTGLSLN